MRRVTVAEVLRALGPHDRARTACLARFRTLGGQLDRVDTQRADRERMCEALLHAEDVVERTVGGVRRPYDEPDRHDVRHIRRALETELWP